MLRSHLRESGTAPDGRLFRGARGGMLSESVYGRAWHAARQAAFGPELAATVLARRPYDLRHAALSLWLNASGAPAEVAAGQQLPSAELRGQGPQMDYFAAPTSRYAVGCRAAWFLAGGTPITDEPRLVRSGMPRGARNWSQEVQPDEGDPDV